MNIEEFKTSTELFKKILERLTEPYPEGTIKEGSTAIIPVQVYIKRLNDVVGPFWSWERVGEATIYRDEDLVEVKGILTILDSKRTGTGFSKLQRYKDTGKISNLKNAIKSADSDALRDACNLFMMGWKDLAPYRTEWGNNPALGLLNEHERNDTSSRTRKCKMCQKQLNSEDEKTLREHNMNIPYCLEHIPSHFFNHGKK